MSVAYTPKRVLLKMAGIAVGKKLLGRKDKAYYFYDFTTLRDVQEKILLVKVHYREYDVVRKQSLHNPQHCSCLL